MKCIYREYARYWRETYICVDVPFDLDTRKYSDAEAVLSNLELKAEPIHHKWGWVRCNLDGIHYVIVRSSGNPQYLLERDGAISIEYRQKILEMIEVHAIELRKNN